MLSSAARQVCPCSLYRITDAVGTSSASSRPPDQTPCCHLSSSSCAPKELPCWIVPVLGGPSNPARGVLLGAMGSSEAAALRAACRALEEGSRDSSGRMLVGEAVIPPARASPLLLQVSPKLVHRLSLPGISGPEVLEAIARLRPDLGNLREVHVHLAAPRLVRVARGLTGSHNKTAKELADGLASVLPEWLVAVEMDVRGGCLLAGDGALEQICASIPRHLRRLRLDLNQFSLSSAKAVANALPPSLRALRLVFHGRSFNWLGTGGRVADDGSPEVLAQALPPGLQALRLQLECSDSDAVTLCGSLPEGLRELDLALHIRSQSRLRTCTPERLPRSFALVLPHLQQLRALRLSLVDYVVGLEGIRALARALPAQLADLRLDICSRDVGNEGAEVLAAALPCGLERLALCLRSWRFTARGVKALAQALPKQARTVKLVFSSSPIGPTGARALVTSLPWSLERLNLSLRLCSVGPDGERALQALARRWAGRPQSWVRVREKLSPICTSLEQSLEWDLWDD